MLHIRTPFPYRCTVTALVNFTSLWERIAAPLLVALLLISNLLCAVASHAADDNAAPTDILSVVVEGLDAQLRDNALALLEINRFAGKTAPDETRLRWLFNAGEREIRHALEPFGYYQPTIQSSLEQSAQGWVARYHVQAGRALPLVAVDVQVLGAGHDDPVFRRFLENLPLTVGKTLNQPQYEQMKTALESIATERGYFDARFAKRVILVDLEAYTAAIHLHYDSGVRYRFSDISFQQKILSPKFLWRYPTFKPNDPYNAQELLTLQSNLNNSGYFKQAGVTAQPDSVTHTTPVTVELEPNYQHKYSFGLGYGTDTGVRASAKVEQRWVNDMGHSYDVQVRLSPINSMLGARYRIPGANPVTDEYQITGGYVRQNYKDQDYETYSLGGAWQMEEGKWLKNYNLNFQHENFETGKETTSNSFLLMPGFNWTWVSADNRLNTKRGLLFGFGLRGASSALLSDITFLQGTVNMRGVYALDDDNRFLTRGNFGTTWIADSFYEFPTSLRFFAGGDTSVRGYAFNSIGSENDKGAVIGGENLLVGSLEYERRVYGDWSVAAFIDSGDAFDGAVPELKTGVGLGLRWRTPVGPVRLDFATGLDRPPGDAFRFSLSVGPDL